MRSSLAFIAVSVCVLTSASELTDYRGNGFSFSYQATWKKQVVGETVVLLTPEEENQICFKIFPSGEKDVNTFFEHYRQFARGALGFEPTFGSSREPTAYGNWRGETLIGSGMPAAGLSYFVTATAIPANGQVYLLQMAAPVARSWEAYTYRRNLANSLKFARPPSEPKSVAGSCKDCFNMGVNAMDALTKQTIQGMK